ncbi:ATP-binding domain-containing protein [Sulfitobacter sp. AS92]|uniref:DEAD/DEAH box helicase n=1 Tax=Sulfitobacter sp. AS92 TaxID=3135783 RepID=UPI00317837FF
MPVNYIPTIGRSEEKHDISLVVSEINAESVFPKQENVVLYAGWPQVKDYDGRTHTSDLTAVTSEHGIKLVKYSASADINILRKEAHSILQAAATTDSLLSKSLILKKKRRLIIDVVPVLFAPNLDAEELGVADVEVAVSQHQLLEIFLEEDESLNEEQEVEIRAIIEGAKALGQLKPVDDVSDAPPLAKALADLEAIIYNFDATQRSVALTNIAGPQRIRGLAGTGKTVILAMKAALAHIEDPSANILITYFTRSLRDVIERLVTRFHRHFAETDPNWERIHVRHGWGRSNTPGVYRDTCIREGRSPKSFNDLRGHADPFGAACSELVAANAISPYYDVILIDEGQDFPDGFYQMCFYLAKGERDKKQIVWAYDELQNVFNVEVREPETLFGNDSDGQPRVSLGRSLPQGTDTNDFVLQRSYRNQREVLVLAHALGFGVYSNTVQMLENAKHWEDVGYEVVAGTFDTDSNNVVERPLRNSPSVLNSPDAVPVISLNSAPNIDDEVELAAQEVKKFIDDGILAHQILIISLDDRSARRYFSNISDRLNQWGIPCNNIIRDKYSEPPFRIDGMVTMSTVYRAKGNEAAVVIVVGSDAATLQTRTGRNKLFVTLTRTKAWLRIFGVETKVFQSLRAEIEKAVSEAPRISFKMPNMNTLNTIQRGLEEKHARRIEAKRRLEKMKSDLNLSDDDIGSLIED